MTARIAGRIGTIDRLGAVMASPSLIRMAGEFEGEHRVGRRPVHPPYVMLQFAALARLARSAVRVELDLSNPVTWSYARSLTLEAIRIHELDVPPPGSNPPTWEQWRWFRDRTLTTDEGLGALGRSFPVLAVELARRIGQLDPHGAGSLTHPDASRVVYGDGTIVRPIYQPPAAVRVDDDEGRVVPMYPDRRTGELLRRPQGRFDPDLAEHHGHTGSVLGHGYVAFHTRGSSAYQRVVLGVDHIDAPGHEAACAVRLLADIARHARSGIQLVVYDGAFRGTHIDHVMRRHGYLVISKMPTGEGDDRAAQVVRMSNGRTARSFPLGLVSHDVAVGPCRHALGTVGGRVVQLDLDDRGDPVVVATPRRGPIKRSRRANGEYHFNLGYDVQCPAGDFTVWLSPHGSDEGASRPENLRAIPDGDPDSLRLRGLRSDAESFHANLKRTLLVDRAMSLGWRRGLVDTYAFAMLNNALTEAVAQRGQLAGPGSRRRRLAE